MLGNRCLDGVTGTAEVDINGVSERPFIVGIRCAHSGDARVGDDDVHRPQLADTRPNRGAERAQVADRPPASQQFGD